MNRNVSRDDIDDRWAAALIGNVGQLDAGHALEILGIEMVGRARTARRIREQPRICFRKRDQVCSRMDRQRWMNNEYERNLGDERNRGKILDRVIGQLPVDRSVDGKGGAGLNQSMSISGRPRCHGHPDHGGCSRPVLDDHRFPKSFRQSRSEHAPKRVLGPASWPRNDQRDWPGWILLRLGNQ